MGSICPPTFVSYGQVPRTFCLRKCEHWNGSHRCPRRRSKRNASVSGQNKAPSSYICTKLATACSAGHCGERDRFKRVWMEEEKSIFRAHYRTTSSFMFHSIFLMMKSMKQKRERIFHFRIIGTLKFRAWLTYLSSEPTAQAITLVRNVLGKGRQPYSLKGL